VSKILKHIQKNLKKQL